MSLKNIFSVNQFNKKNKNEVKEAAQKIYKYLEKHESDLLRYLTDNKLQVFAGTEEYLDIKIILLLKNVILPNISKEKNLEDLRSTLRFFADLTTYTSDMADISFTTSKEAQSLGEHYAEHTVGTLYILEGIVQNIIDDPIMLQKYTLLVQVSELEKMLHAVKGQSKNVKNIEILENWEKSLSDSKKTLASYIEGEPGKTTPGEIASLRKDIMSNSLGCVQKLQDVQNNGVSLLSYLAYKIKNLFNESSFAKSKNAFKGIFGSIENSKEPMDLPTTRPNGPNQ